MGLLDVTSKEESVMNTNNPCPNCGVPMADFSTPDEKYFICDSCGARVSWTVPGTRKHMTKEQETRCLNCQNNQSAKHVIGRLSINCSVGTPYESCEQYIPEGEEL